MATQRQIEANRRNRKKWRGFTPEGRRRLREAALRNRPWEHSTGPRTKKGKAKAAENGRSRGPVRKSWKLLRLYKFVNDLAAVYSGRKPRSCLKPPADCRSLEDVIRTMDRYSHTVLGDLSEALTQLPDLENRSPRENAAAGHRDARQGL